MALVAAVEVAAGWAEGVYTLRYMVLRLRLGGRWLTYFGDGWVRFNRISNILPIRRLHPARTFFQTTIRRIFTPSVEWFWVQFRFQINITVKGVRCFSIPVVFSRSCYSAAVSFRLLYRSKLQRLLELAWRGGRRRMTLSDVGSVCDSYVRLSGLCGSCVSLYRCCCLFRINFGMVFLTILFV
jgi:hypothetical protein